MRVHATQQRTQMQEQPDVARREPHAWAFGGFVLDRADASLWRDERRIPLPPKPYQLLELLLRHAGALVPKQEILREVWAQTFVTDAVVKVCVAQLRKALDDPAAAPRWIVNEPRRGYRFIGAVTSVASLEGARIDPAVSLLDLTRLGAGLEHSADRVLERALQLADEAARERDYAACAEHLAVACTSARFLHPDDDALLYELTLRLGEAARRAGRRAEAQAALLGAITQARSRGQRERFARAVLALGTAHQSVLGTDVSLVELLDEAEAWLEGADDPLHACIEARLAYALVSDPAAASRRSVLAASARLRARGRRSTREEAFILRYRVWAGWGPADLRLRLAASRRLEELGERLESPETCLHALGLRISAALESADAKTFEETLGRYVKLAEASRQPWFEWAALRFRILHAMLLDRFDDAERWIADGVARARTLEHPDVLALFYAQMVALRLQQGRHQEVLGFLEHGVRQAVPASSWKAALAYARAAQGEHASAAALLHELCADGLRAVSRDALWKGSLVLLADACALLPERKLARELYQALLPYQNHCAVLYGFACLGSLHRPLGLLAAKLGRLSAARRHFELAILLHRRLGATGWEERTRVERDRSLGAFH